ncbi:unnamed protein product [Rhodiola kirilowii]
MASTEGLVPITRTFLASFYDKYPFSSLSEDVARLTSQIRSFTADLKDQFPLSEGESSLVNEVDRLPPHKMDENMWKNREHIEEIIFLLEESHWPQLLQQQPTPEEINLGIILEQLKEKFIYTLKVLESFQSKNSENIFNTVMTYMPQDFRGTLIKQQRERSEKAKQAEIDAVVNSGGSIRDRYALLWRQQMDRRKQLALLGSATGVYKTLVKYLVGVPQVLLDFIRQINDDEGPMEEQRHRYGPPLAGPQATVLQQAADVYTSEIERFINFISEVFANSPFFISAEEAGAMDARKNEEYKEITILAGKTHEVSLPDIGFSVECTNSAGEKTMILPYRRYESDQGNFCTCVAGNYTLIWDNSYSSFFRKDLRYKVDCIPPVVEPVEPVDEAEG